MASSNSSINKVGNDLTINIEQNTTSVSSGGSCEIQVGHNMKMNIEQNTANISSVRVFKVRKSLRDSNNRSYSPELVSIGPLHYGNDELKKMEEAKSEAVRVMQERIQKKDPNISIASIVEVDMLPKDNEIRNFYGELIPFNPKELAWMIMRDACFLLQFLITYVGRSSMIGLSLEEVTLSSGTGDAVPDIMKDILLFENQIPFWVLRHLLVKQSGSEEEADGTLEMLMGLLLIRTTRHKVFLWNVELHYTKCCHVLEVVYHGMVGADVSSYEEIEAERLSSFRANRIWKFFRNVVKFIKSNCGCPRMWLRRRGMALKFFEKITADTMKPLLKLPTAVELTRRGVIIRPVLERHIDLENFWGWEETFPAIRYIRFDQETSTLYLPELRITPHSVSAMKNIIAMEMSIKGRYHPRPLTQFGIFMDELIDREEDVDVLRKAKVINNFLGSNDQVADLFNSLTNGIALDQNCRIIQAARHGLCLHKARKSKVLWIEFVGTHFSKPWIAASTIGAVLLLLLTAAQVFCLFYACNP